MSDLPTSEQLIHRDFEDIEYAYVRFSKGDPTDYEAGRIVDRFQSDLTLAYRGHTTEVTQIGEWEVVEYEPVRSSIQKQQIAAELEVDA